MAYDSLNGLCLCLVWDDATGQHQTWAFDASARKWTAMKPEKEPDTSMSRSRNPITTFTVCNQPPLLGNLRIKVGNNASRKNGKAKVER